MLSEVVNDGVIMGSGSVVSLSLYLLLLQFSILFGDFAAIEERPTSTKSGNYCNSDGDGSGVQKKILEKRGDDHDTLRASPTGTASASSHSIATTGTSARGRVTIDGVGNSSSTTRAEWRASTSGVEGGLSTDDLAHHAVFALDVDDVAASGSTTTPGGSRLIDGGIRPKATATATSTRDKPSKGGLTSGATRTANGSGACVPHGDDDCGGKGSSVVPAFGVPTGTTRTADSITATSHGTATATSGALDTHPNGPCPGWLQPGAIGAEEARLWCSGVRIRRPLTEVSLEYEQCVRVR
nr:hypothetical protein [Micromonospora sp. CB01531]